MTKSDLKKIIKVIVTEIHAVHQERLAEGKKGLSGFKVTPDKKDNTQMKSDDKSITSTDKPTEKKESKKLPEKGKNNKGNTETDHGVSNKSTPTLKETLVSMIREALAQHPVAEMARTAGSIGSKYKVEVEPGKWIIQGHPTIPDGTPTTPQKNTGLNYTPKPKTPAVAAPTEPTGAEDEEGDQGDEGPDLPQTANSKVNVVLNGKTVGRLNFKTPSGKIDTRPMKAIVNSFVYNNIDLLQYDIDDSMIAKFDELSDMFTDDKLPMNATVQLQVNGETLQVKPEAKKSAPSTVPTKFTTNS